MEECEIPPGFEKAGWISQVKAVIKDREQKLWRLEVHKDNGHLRGSPCSWCLWMLRAVVIRTLPAKCRAFGSSSHLSAIEAEKFGFPKDSGYLKVVCKPQDKARTRTGLGMRIVTGGCGNEQFVGRNRALEEGTLEKRIWYFLGKPSETYEEWQNLDCLSDTDSRSLDKKFWEQWSI